MIRILVLTIALAFTTRFLVHVLGLAPWSYYALLIVLAFVLYVLNSVLIKRYIALRTPEFASTEEAWSGVQKWELTAGTGVVPRWVSLIGLSSFAAVNAHEKGPTFRS